MIETGFVVVEKEEIFTRMDHFLHYQILRSSVELIFSSYNRLQKGQILNMFSVSFNAMDKMLNDFVIDFITQDGISLENCAHCLGFQKLQNIKYESFFVKLKENEKSRAKFREINVQLIYSNLST